MANELVMGRRGFLRFLGASAAVTTTALAAPSVLAGPEAEKRVRRWWQVPRGAPVRSVLSQRWHASDLLMERAFHDSMLPRLLAQPKPFTGLLPASSERLDQLAMQFGVQRRPAQLPSFTVNDPDGKLVLHAESDDELRARITRRLTEPPSNQVIHYAGMDLGRDGGSVSVHFMIDRDGTVRQLQPIATKDDPKHWLREYQGNWMVVDDISDEG